VRVVLGGRAAPATLAGRCIQANLPERISRDRRPTAPGDQSQVFAPVRNRARVLSQPHDLVRGRRNDGRGALDYAIKPLDPASRFVGSALTARAGARDNLAALEAEMRAKVGAGEIRSLLERVPGLRDQTTYIA
jgi:hypothetical protein